MAYILTVTDPANGMAMDSFLHHNMKIPSLFDHLILENLAPLALLSMNKAKHTKAFLVEDLVKRRHSAREMTKDRVQRESNI